MRYLRNTSELSDWFEPLSTTPSIEFVSVVVRDDGRKAFLADRTGSEIRVFDLPGLVFDLTEGYPTSSTLRRLEIQRTTP